MSQFVQLTVYGLANGAVLALAALGFVLIYKATQVINFAQGELLLIGAYSFYSAFVLLRLPWTLAVLAGVLVAALLALVVERFVLRPLVGQDPIAVIMVTIGLAAVLRALVQMFYGTQPREMAAVLPVGTARVAGAGVPVNRLLAIAVAAVVLGAFTVFFTRSRHGVAMRAVADDQQAALTMGISVKRMFALAWVLAAVSALVAGVLLADIGAVEQGIVSFGLIVFPVVVLGGLDSVPGTVVAGVTIGLIKQWVSAYADPGLAQVVPYIVLVLILMVRPYGLFGQVRIERV